MSESIYIQACETDRELTERLARECSEHSRHIWTVRLADISRLLALARKGMEADQSYQSSCGDCAANAAGAAKAPMPSPDLPEAIAEAKRLFREHEKHPRLRSVLAETCLTLCGPLIAAYEAARRELDQYRDYSEPAFYRVNMKVKGTPDAQP